MARRNRSIFFFVLPCVLPGTASAGALCIYEMSNASESGYGGAGMAARANDAGTVFSNPAGMALFDDSAMLAGGVGVYKESCLSPTQKSAHPPSAMPQ